MAARALALARDRGERGNQAWALRLAGEIAARKDVGDAAKAGDQFRQALELARPLGMRPLEAHCLVGLGVLTGDRVALAAAADLYRALDMRFWQGDSRRGGTPATDEPFLSTGSTRSRGPPRP